MAESSDVFCAVCEHEGIKTLAKIWCQTCEEGYCDECVKSHKQLKALRSHHLISVDDHLKTNHFPVSETCSVHNKKYALFCPQHDVVLCLNCFQSDHKTCEVLDLDDASKGCKTSTAMETFDKDADDLLRQIHDGIKEQDGNIESLSGQEKSIRSQIKEIRKQIDDRLDQIQDSILSELTEKLEKHTADIKTEKVTLKTKEKTVIEMNTGISSLREFASEKQMFISIRQNMDLLRKEKESTHSTLSGLNKIDICLTETDNVMSTINQIQTFGKIQIQERSLPNTIDPSRNEAQTDISQSSDIDNMKLTLKKTIKIGSCTPDMCLTSCVLMPNKKLVFVDNNGKKLIVHNTDNSHRLDVAMPFRPFDATAMNDNKVAVTMPKSPTICVVDIDTGLIERNLTDEVFSSCYGITSSGGNIYVLNPGKDIVLLININGTVLSKFTTDSKSIFDINVQNGRLYVVNLSTNCVCICDDKGKSLWSYKDERFCIPKCFKVCFSTSLTTDKYGNVFVVCPDSNIIMAVSNDGKSSRVILEATDNLFVPSGVSYLPATNELLVCNAMNGYAAIYDVQQCK